MWLTVKSGSGSSGVSGKRRFINVFSFYYFEYESFACERNFRPKNIREKRMRQGNATAAAIIIIRRLCFSFLNEQHLV